MENELDKIDIIRERFDVGYEDARRALSASDGDVVGALEIVERGRGSRDLVALGAEVADEVRRLIDGGPIKRVRVRYGNRLVSETPVALTALAAAALTLAAVLISKLAIELEKG